MTLLEFIGKNPAVLQMDETAVLAAFAAAGKERKDGLSSKMTLAEFYKKWYIPNQLAPKARKQGTYDWYEKALEYWEKTMGKTPLTDTSKEQLNLFVVRMRQLKWRGKPLTPAAIKKQCDALTILLNYVGPKSTNYRDAVELIPQPPAFPEIKVCKNITAKTPTLREYGRILHACVNHKIKQPQLPNVTPNEWWYALFTFFYNTGLRYGDVINVAKWNMIRVEDGLTSILIPSDNEKEGHEKRIPLNSKVMEVLELIPRNPRDPEEYIFNWPLSKGTFHDYRREIVQAAAVPLKRGTCHAMRRLLATMTDTATAKLLLHHVDESVTRNNYQAAQANLRALESLPQPE